MGYLADIVSKIDTNQELIFVGTGIILIDTNNKILISQRADNGEWSIPGGSLELGESLEECIVRETFEETGLLLDKERLMFNSVKVMKNAVNKNGRLINVVSVSYWVDGVDRHEITLDNREFKETKWLSLEEINELTHITEYTKVAIEEYRNKL